MERKGDRGRDRVLPANYRKGLEFPFAGTAEDFITALIFCLSSGEVVIELNERGRIIKKDGLVSKARKGPRFQRGYLNRTLFPDTLRGEGGLGYRTFHGCGVASGFYYFSDLRAIYTKKSSEGFSIPQEYLEYLVQYGSQSPEEWLRVPKPEVKRVYEPLPDRIKIGPISQAK